MPEIEETKMNTLAVSAIEIAGACLWLALLMITQFHPVTVSFGLLGGLYLMGQTSSSRQTR